MYVNNLRSWRARKTEEYYICLTLSSYTYSKIYVHAFRTSTSILYVMCFLSTKPQSSQNSKKQSRFFLNVQVYKSTNIRSEMFPFSNLNRFFNWSDLKIC